jgi:hypothetical protein
MLSMFWMTDYRKYVYIFALNNLQPNTTKDSFLPEREANLMFIPETFQT